MIISRTVLKHLVEHLFQEEFQESDSIWFFCGHIIKIT